MHTSHRAIDDPRIVWHAFDGLSAWAGSAAQAVAAHLREALRNESRARLLLSGGSTPEAVYRALAGIDLDWARIDVGLVDERDVDADHVASNARLIRESLIDVARTAPDFHALRGLGQSIADSLRVVNTDPALDPQDAILVLGMGDDGHTASLFPGARNLDFALTTTAAYAAIDASASPGAGTYAQRLSLTASGLAKAAARILLLRGEGKRRVFESALLPGDIAAMPIRAALIDHASPLHVFWSCE